jgi:hypothetical protein
MASDRVLREDSLLVTLGDDPTPWMSAMGGARSENGYTDLVLTRVRRDSSPPEIVEWSRRVGRWTRVTVAHVTPDMTPTSSGLVYEGVLVRVQPAEYDANSHSVAVDRVVLRPFSMEALSGR